MKEIELCDLLDEYDPVGVSPDIDEDSDVGSISSIASCWRKDIFATTKTRTHPVEWIREDDVLKKHSINKIITTQNFHRIRKKCLKDGELFCDVDFLPESKNLVDPKSRVIWMRPNEICLQLRLNKMPKMFVNSYDRFDIKQGSVGDCWLLAAMANLAESKDYFPLVVPDWKMPNAFQKDYAGIFRFRFWKLGRWREIIIDDFLPTEASYFDRSRGDLIYVKSIALNEFWSALLEKAYAKFSGGYKYLEGGLANEAAVAFTGGIPELINLEAIDWSRDRIFYLLKTSFDRGSFMSCAMGISDIHHMNEGISLGLQKFHAYTISKIVRIPMFDGSNIRLLRIRNPHGNFQEWRGPWSDRDINWNYISENIKQKLRLRFSNDGEFYICFEDFMKYFAQVQICHLTLDDVDDRNGEKRFELFEYHGKWQGESAGGCGNDGYQSFAKNPQYYIDLYHCDPFYGKNKCPVIISLAQSTNKRKSELAIGFEVYKCPSKSLRLTPEYLYFHKTVEEKRLPFTNLREVSRRMLLPSGRYCIIPCTFRKGDERKFHLRIFIEKNKGYAEDDAERFAALNMKYINEKNLTSIFEYNKSILT